MRDGRSGGSNNFRGSRDASRNNPKNRSISSQREQTAWALVNRPSI